MLSRNFIYRTLLLIIFVCLFIFSPAAKHAVAATEPLPYTDVLIDAGHGGIDGGAVHGELLEKNINLAIAGKLYAALSNRGVTAVLNRNGDYALSDENRWLRIPSRHKRDLAQRTQLANELKPRLVVSLHINTSRDPHNSGPLVMYQRNVASRTAAVILQQALNEYYGTSGRPVFGKTYYLLNHSDNPAVIVELGFLTNAADRARLTDPKQQRKLAELMAAVIENYVKG